MNIFTTNQTSQSSGSGFYFGTASTIKKNFSVVNLVMVSEEGLFSPCHVMASDVEKVKRSLSKSKQLCLYYGNSCAMCPEKKKERSKTSALSNLPRISHWCSLSKATSLGETIDVTRDGQENFNGNDRNWKKINRPIKNLLNNWQVKYRTTILLSNFISIVQTNWH